MTRNWKHYVRERLPRLRVAPEREVEIIEELAGQLEATYDRARAGGASDAEAMRRADEEIPDWRALAATLGRVERPFTPPPTAGAPAGGFMNGFAGDIRFALRTLRRSPVFSAVAIGTLALGLGMAAAAYSVIDTVLIRPLRFRSPERLVLVHATVPPNGRDTNEITYLDAMDLARETRAFASVALVTPFSGTATALDPPERITGYDVTTSIFDTLGVQPVLGRAFTAAEGQPGGNDVVILGHGFWRRLGSRADIIGQTLVLDDVPRTIVGVMPEHFRIEVFNQAGDVYRPITPRHFAASNRQFRAFRALARLADGASIEQAQHVAGAVGEQLARQYPESNRGRTFSLVPLHHEITGAVRPALFLIAGLVAVVLTIAGVNLMNLLLARAIARAREVAVRSALGAGAWRLARGSLAEAALLAVFGAIGGAFLAHGILSVLAELPGIRLPRQADLGLEWRALAALATAAIASSILVGAVPFLWHRRLHDTAALRTGHETAGRLQHRVRGVLVAAQTGLAFMLVAATALLALSLERLLAVPTGFDANVVTMRIAAPAARYPTREVTTRFFNDLVDEVSRQPGIDQAGVVWLLPLSGSAGSTMTVQGREDIPMTERPEVGWLWADAGYFGAIGMPIVNGRGFMPGDLESQAHVTVISQTLAERHFPGEDPIGKRVHFGSIPATGVPEWHEIIGVVGDVRHRSLEREPDARAYDLFGQHWDRTVSLALRTSEPPAVAAAKVRSVLARRDPKLAVFAIQSTGEIISNAVASRRLLLWLVGAFALTGFVVATLGVYGLVSCLVAERQREIGVRMALGASIADIHRLVLNHGFTLVVAGLAAGAAGAVALRQTIASQLYETSPTSLPALAGAAIALLAAAAVPCLIGARRAAKVDPVRALRSE